jgi:molybdate transport system substrate-binding protein
MRPAVRRRHAVAALALAGLLPAACSRGAAGAAPKRVTVFAAASLTESFTTIARRFEAAHPGVSVRLVFGPSPDLARQIVDGAAADVYAAASAGSVNALTAAHLVEGAPTTFARNRLELAVPPSNPAGVTALADLQRPGVTFAICAVEVPCGAAAKQLLSAAHSTATPVTYERDVKAVLAKVRLGEVDAGLVYRTDIRAESRGSGTSKVTGIDIPAAADVVNDYPIVTINRSADTSRAREFVELVLSADGRAVLTDAGFDAP